jgi:hypothetical protein
LGYFKIKAKTDLQTAPVGTRIDESDFSTLLDNGEFVQLEYMEEEDKVIEPYTVNPGIWIR